MRPGDVILTARCLTAYHVREVGTEYVTAARWPHRPRRFRLSDLECVDPEGGIWQEVEAA